MPVSKALCILDGALNSTICAVLALQQFDEVHAVICNDGHKNALALESAIAIADTLKLASYEIIDLSSLLSGSRFHQTARSNDRPYRQLDQASNHKPNFDSVPDILALTSAANVAAVLGIKNIFIDICPAEFSDSEHNYQALINSLAEVLGKAMWHDPKALTVHTPLMHLTKVERMQLAIDLLGEQFQSVLELTHDCLSGTEGGCGCCDACLLRDRAFWETGLEDPIWKFRYAQTSRFIASLSQVNPDLARL